MIYSPQAKFLFVHVSRTGGTSLANFFYRHCPDLRSISPQHAGIVHAQRALGAELDAFYKFAVVRNPWDRLHSWYALLGAANPNLKEAIADPSHPYWRGFDAFLERWLSKRCEYAGRSLPELSQSAQLSNADGELALDHIARFEHYAEEVQALCARFGWPSHALTRENAGPKREHYRHYYSRFGAELVAHTLSEDLRQFGYRF